ncbi:hypothetical protein ACH492_39975, partial [Streptomyces sp. NPDC019443]
TVHFHQLQRGTADRVRNKRVNERTGEEVPLEKTVKSYAGGKRSARATDLPATPTRRCLLPLGPLSWVRQARAGISR